MQVTWWVKVTGHSSEMCVTLQLIFKSLILHRSHPDAPFKMSVPESGPGKGPCQYVDIRQASSSRITGLRNPALPTTFRDTPHLFFRHHNSLKPKATQGWGGQRFDLPSGVSKLQLCGEQPIYHCLSTTVTISHCATLYWSK